MNDSNNINRLKKDMNEAILANTREKARTITSALNAFDKKFQETQDIIHPNIKSTTMLSRVGESIMNIKNGSCLANGVFLEVA